MLLEDNDGNPIFSYLGGIGRAILGRSHKFRDQNVLNRINVKEILIDTDFSQLLLVANNVPHLNLAITKGAQMFSNAEVCHKDKDGNDLGDTDAIKLLNNPNPTSNSLEKFLYDFYINYAIYGDVFIYKNYSTRLLELPQLMWVLPSGLMQIKATGKLYRQRTIEEIIESYILQQDPTPFLPKEIIHFSEGISFNGISAVSKIQSLQIPLSNIVAALKSNNIILTERGLIGFVSPGSTKDTFGQALPWTSEAKERQEKEFQRNRSLDSDKGHVMFSQTALQWTPMTFDVSQLKIYEGLQDAFNNICDSYGISKFIFGTGGKDSTYENYKQGMIGTYENTMQPLLNKALNVFANDLKITSRGEYFEGNYDWLKIMQDDKVKEGQAKYYMAQATDILLKNGTINHDTIAEECEVEMTGDKTIIQSTPPVKNIPADPSTPPN